MKVFVNLPDTANGKKLLASRVADFHATLMLEKIKKLKYNDTSKDKILSLVLNQITTEKEKTNKKNVCN